MPAVDDLDQVLEQNHLALGEFLKGNPEPVKKQWSHRDDVTLTDPLVGPRARGWEQVSATVEHAASQVRDGAFVSFETVAEYVTPELAYVLGIERNKAKVGGREDIAPITFRVTMIFRPEDGTWRIVHWHADPITTPQPAESVIQKEIHL